MKTICRSKFYALYQSDEERCHYLDMGQKTIKLSFCQLLALRHKVQKIAIEDHFDADFNKHGFEMLMLCNKEHLFILNTLEILDLMTLVEKSFYKLGIAHPTSTVV